MQRLVKTLLDPGGGGRDFLAKETPNQGKAISLQRRLPYIAFTGGGIVALIGERTGIQQGAGGLLRFPCFPQ